MLFTLLAALAAGPSAPTATGPQGPEPVLEWAEPDLKKLKQARVAQLAAVTVPAVFLAGAFAVRQVPLKPDGSFPLNPQSISAGSMFWLGGLGMIVSSSVFHRRTIKSRYYLTKQGLRIFRTPPVVVPALATLGVAAAVGASTVNGPGDDVEAGALVLGLGLYAVSVGVGTYQLDLNRRARREAGWIGVVPSVTSRAPGLALAGRW